MLFVAFIVGFLFGSWWQKEIKDGKNPISTITGFFKSMNPKDTKDKSL